MKLIVATIQDQDADAATSNLTNRGYRVTRIGSTGGFLRQGNTTLLVGVEDRCDTCPWLRARPRTG
jgi:uncharacterized protein YaaQ